MKKGHLMIEIHMKENENDKPYFWCICEWTGRTWYNTGYSGRASTANQAWRQARRKYIAVYDASTKCTNCNGEAVYAGECPDCLVDKLSYRLYQHEELFRKCLAVLDYAKTESDIVIKGIDETMDGLKRELDLIK